MSHFFAGRVLRISFAMIILLLLTQSIWRWWAFERNDFSSHLEGTWRVGEFQVLLSEHHFIVDHMPSNTRVFKNVRGERFINLDQREVSLTEHRGMIDIDVDRSWSLCEQHVTRVEADQDSFDLVGSIDCLGDVRPYRLSVKPGDQYVDFELVGSDADLLSLEIEMPPREFAVGFGAQFSRVNMRGLSVPIVVSEQGIGRGQQPLTAMVDAVAGAGGAWHSTYAPVPWFFTSSDRGFWLKTDRVSWFDFSVSDRVIVSVADHQLALRAYVATSPKDLISLYTQDTGRMSTPPDWLNDGIIVGVQGGSEVTQEKLAQLTGQTEVAAVWIQDWVGQRTTSFGKQLWWNWRLDQDHYSDYATWHSRLQDQGVRVLAYLNPSLVPDPDEVGNDLYRLMIENDGFVVNGEGSPIEFLNSSFDSNLLDLANDDAMELWVDTVAERLKSLNVSGWMADFGESFPFVEGHNGYPVLWSKWNRTLAERMGLSEPFIFHRSAYVGSAEVSGAFWLGDQMVDWSSQDGIKSAVTGLLTSGMSGMPVTHSDIGGYTTIDHPLRSVTRSRELLARWLELNSFGLIMRSHEGNLPELNSQIYDQEMLPHVRSSVARFVSLSDYRHRLYEEMEASGVPPIRHPLLEYPQISRFWGMRFEQFFLGSELMVVPVLNSGQSSVDVILPPGEWRLMGSNDVYQGASGGRLINLSAPLGSPVALVMVGSELDRSMSDR